MQLKRVAIIAAVRVVAHEVHRSCTSTVLIVPDGYAGADTITLSFLVSGTDALGKQRHVARRIAIEGRNEPFDVRNEIFVARNGIFDARNEVLDAIDAGSRYEDPGSR